MASPWTKEISIPLLNQLSFLKLLLSSMEASVTGGISEVLDLLL